MRWRLSIYVLVVLSLYPAPPTLEAMRIDADTVAHGGGGNGSSSYVRTRYAFDVSSEESPALRRLRITSIVSPDRMIRRSGQDHFRRSVIARRISVTKRKHGRI